MSLARTAGSVILILFGAYLINASLLPLNYVNALVGIIAATAGFVFLGRGRARGRGGRKLTVAFDFIAVVLVAIFALSIMFGGLGGLIGKDQASLNLSLFLLSLEGTAVILMLISGVFAVSASTSKTLFNKQLLYIAASFAGFFVLNLVVPPTAPVFFRQSLASANGFVTVIISVPEETMFRGWLAPWLANVSHTGVIGGSLGSAAIFMVYHLFAYGTNPANLLIVFGAGAIEGFAALKTGRLSTTLANHTVNNFLSVTLHG